jgi:Tol biopolymer transport system component
MRSRVALSLLLLLVVVAPAAAAPGDTVLISRSGNETNDTVGEAVGGPLSLDPRYAFFGAPSFDRQWYRYDLAEHRTETATPYFVAGSGPVNGATGSVDVSPDGDWVVYVTNSPAPGGEDNDDRDPDAFLHRRSTRETWLVNTDYRTNPGGTTVSDDGSRVGYASGSTLNVFDRASKTSRTVTFTNETRRNCQEPDLSGNGRFLVYQCNDGEAIYRQDLDSGIELKIADLALNPKVSADGNLVFYERSSAPDDYGVWVRDLAAGTTTRVDRTITVGEHVLDAGGGIRISADGRYVGYTTRKKDGAGPNLGVVVDRVEGDLEIASRASGADGRLPAYPQTLDAISPDGRFATFSGEDGSLDPLVQGKRGSAYRRELLVTGTRTISPSPPGGAAPSPTATRVLPGAGKPAKRKVRLQLGVRLRLGRRRILTLPVVNDTSARLRGRLTIRAGRQRLLRRTVVLRPRAVTRLRVRIGPRMLRRLRHSPMRIVVSGAFGAERLYAAARVSRTASSG